MTIFLALRVIITSEKKITTGIIEIPKSNCDYFYKLNLKSANKSSKIKPLTNRPIDYPLSKFQTSFGSNNFKTHYEQSHSIEWSFIVTEEEKSAILN